MKKKKKMKKKKTKMGDFKVGSFANDTRSLAFKANLYNGCSIFNST